MNPEHMAVPYMETRRESFRPCIQQMSFDHVARNVVLSYLRVTTAKDPAATRGVQPTKPSPWKRPCSSSRSSSRPAASLKL